MWNEQVDLKLVAGVAAIFVALGAIMFTLAIGWEAAWAGAVVAIPGALLAGGFYAIMRNRRAARHRGR